MGQASSSDPPVLFWYPGTCARIPFVALEEIGEPFEVNVVDLIGGADPGYADINPKGKVPTLIIDGHTITENPAIHTYLSRRHPELGLLPQGTRGRLEALETDLSWFAAGVHPPITRQRFPRFSCEDPAAHPDIQGARAGAALPPASRSSRAGWRAGSGCSASGASSTSTCSGSWFRAVGSGMDGSLFPRCAAHADRCEERPSVASVLAREEAELARLDAACRVPRPRSLPTRPAALPGSLSGRPTDMYFARSTDAGPTGRPPTRVLAAPGSSGPWFDVRVAERVRRERGGASPAAAARIAAALVPSSMSAAIAGGEAFLEASESAHAYPGGAGRVEGDPTPTLALDPAGHRDVT